LKVSFENQPQIGSTYFPILVLDVSSEVLQKDFKNVKHLSFYLVVNPFYLGIAEDAKKANKNHKRVKASIGYEQIEDIEIVLNDLLNQSKSSNSPDRFSNDNANTGEIRIYYSEEEKDQEIRIKSLGEH
jgi:hypothetical protein